MPSIHVIDSLVPAKIVRLFGEPFARAHDRMETYVRQVAREILRQLVQSPDEVFGVAALQGRVVPAAHALVAWVVGFLADQGDLEPVDDRFRCAFVAGLPERPALRAAAIAEHPGVAASYALVDRCADGATDFLQGKSPGENIVFSLSALGLWFDYVSNDNALYAVNNRIAALALADSLRPEDRGRAILELGGGAASAALAFLDEAQERTGFGPFHYHFTEPMPAFARRGERSLRARLPGGWQLSTGATDFNRPFSEQGIADGSLAAIWAVNAVHVATDLEATLGFFRQALAARGTLVIGECVRPFPGQPIYTEFVFNFLESFRSVKTTRLRPNHGFLSPDDWIALLEATGYVDVHVVPDVRKIREVYPKFFAGAIVGRKE